MLFAGVKTPGITTRYLNQTDQLITENNVSLSLVIKRPGSRQAEASCCVVQCQTQTFARRLLSETCGGNENVR